MPSAASPPSEARGELTASQRFQQLPAEKLEAAAARYGIPLGAGLAKEMTEHFERRRTAVLTYRR